MRLDRFKGSITALVTPFRNGAVDEEAFAGLIEWQIGEGTHGLVPVGTTGESPTLTPDEHARVVTLAVEVVKGRVPVIAGAGSNATSEAIHYVRHAEAAGAEAVLVATPYYNKPTQEGLYAHYKALNDCAQIPIFLYNIPGRSVVDMSIETMARLSELPNIVGVKDATANLARVTPQKMACRKGFLQISGEDSTALGFNAHGGVGCISVTANVAPRLSAEFQTACLAGDYAKALVLHEKLAPLHRALFLEASPAPVKWALAAIGKCRDEVRLPLVPATDAVKGEIRSALLHAGLSPRL